MTEIVTRRDMLQTGIGSVGVLLTWLAQSDFLFADQQANEELVPFLDMPRPGPNRLDWETLDAWLTMNSSQGYVSTSSLDLDPGEIRFIDSELVFWGRHSPDRTDYLRMPDDATLAWDDDAGVLHLRDASGERTVAGPGHAARPTWSDDGRYVAQETADGKEHAPAGSVCGNGLVRKLRTGGGKTARLPEEGRNANLICPNRGEQHLLDHTP